MEIEETKQTTNDDQSDAFVWSELQFKKELVEPESKRFSEVFIKDLNLTNFNEPDIFASRNILEGIKSFNMFGLTEVCKEVLVPSLFNVVNTARSRDGFERKAQITSIKDERADIKQSGGNTSLWNKLTSRGNK